MTGEGRLSQKLHIKTWGCQMNVYDSARMADVLAPEGYETTDRAEDADLVILNTCHIREKAAEKVFSELGRLRALRDARPGGMTIAVAGCVAQAEGAEIVARAPFVDLVVGPQAYPDLPAMLRTAQGRPGRPVLNTDFPAEDKFDRLPMPPAGPARPAALLSVQEGCDKFCSFCVVPYTRGAEASRPVAAIVAEAEALVRRGTIEITLLGQNVNAWHGLGPDGASWGLGRLLGRLSEIEGLERLRYTTSHPLDMDDALIAAHGRLETLMPFLHLPVQSGSDPVLAAMNRRHRVADYRAVIARLRDARPDIAFSSDFIVGFPGETEDDFARTLDLVAEIGFAQAYCFRYSPRPGTPAAGRDDQVPEPVKDERLARLQAAVGAGQSEFNAGFVGRMMPVLFDRPGRRPGQVLGRSPWMHPVHAGGPQSLLGRLAAVRILSAGPLSLAGAIQAEGARSERARA